MNFQPRKVREGHPGDLQQVLAGRHPRILFRRHVGGLQLYPGRVPVRHFASGQQRVRPGHKARARVLGH